jgi:hypothetical protein
MLAPHGAKRRCRTRTRWSMRIVARGQRDQAQHHLEQRALAGAVVADQAEQFAADDVEIDAVDRMHGAVMLGDAVRIRRLPR